MKKIASALISCYHKEGLLPLVSYLHQHNVRIYTTGGTATYLEQHSIACEKIEDLTGYPSILGGRVKTLHPSVMGGILARDTDSDRADREQYHIPSIDLVVVDLYPFADAVKEHKSESECIEKIDIGGVSLLRAAAKNFESCAVVSHSSQYHTTLEWLQQQDLCLSLHQRQLLAKSCFAEVAKYDLAIAHYFDSSLSVLIDTYPAHSLRYGENPHQPATFYGDLATQFTQLHGKALSYNNLLDVDSALHFLSDVQDLKETCWAIIKHNNICGASIDSHALDAWNKALAGDKESAFGGILCSNQKIDEVTAKEMSKLFFEILLVPEIDEKCLAIFQTKKNSIILQYHKNRLHPQQDMRTLLGGVLVQSKDDKNFLQWKEVSEVPLSESDKKDLSFANVICKHLKSNAISIVNNQQLIGKGCGQTSRIDAMKQAIAKAKQFGHSLEGGVLASDAFFPFDDCVRIAKEVGIKAIIQPGGSIRDEDSIQYAKANGLGMILTETRHFRH